MSTYARSGILQAFSRPRSHVGLLSPFNATLSTRLHSSRSFPAIFVRGGTSNGLIIHRKDLPPQNDWHTVLPAAMGSPDSYGRQLSGIGSGISSTSKIIVLSPPSRPDVDLDYTFVQVGIKDGSLDMAGNCGNMSSAVGPMSLDESLVDNPEIEELDGHKYAAVRIFNTNTSKVILSRFRVNGNPPRYCPDGDYTMDGVPGTNSPITLSFLDPAGAKTGKALPTGNACDWLQLSNDRSIKASLVDVSNPGVFVRACDLGIPSAEDLTPQAIEADPSLKAALDEIRRAGASAMGLDPGVESVPKIALLFSDTRSPDVDIRCLAMSMGQAHKAVPLTLALCLGAASQIPGTLAAQIVGSKPRKSVVIGHPSGKVDIGTTFEGSKIKSADLHRTARVLMKGQVFY
ncbi:3-methylitaconate isomerase [Colletotrichum sp. SAR 10_99]|nr:3-methylitaconate isomerase [Colletotrichum sp. SAR 10_99]